MKLDLASAPLVVGTIAQADTLAQYRRPAIPACDIIEVRLDKIGAQTPNWVGQCKRVEVQGLPVLFTLRLAAEGGEWKRPDEDRLMMFTTALEHLAAIDIELQSRLVPKLAVTARKLGKTLIVSAHDFIKTPSLSALHDLALEASRYASIIKIVTLVKTDADVAILRQLLTQDFGVPLCVMGMGPLGPATRTEFPTLGSVLTYGWLDEPMSPDQPSAAELRKQLHTPAPGAPSTSQVR